MGVQLAVNIFTVLPTDNKNGAPVISEAASNWLASGKFVLGDTDFGLWPFQPSMEKLLEDHSRVSIRNVMLKHEKIFKEQVQELHRLYEVQKMLVKEMGKQLRLHSIVVATSKDLSDTRSSYLSNHSPPFRENTFSLGHTHEGFHQNSVNAETRSQVEVLKLQRGLNLDLFSWEGPNRCFFSLEDLSKKKENDKLCIESSHLSDNEDSDLELTLSLGSSNSRKSSRQKTCSNPELGPAKSNFTDTTRRSVNFELQKEGNSGQDAALASEGIQHPSGFFRTLSLSRR